MSFLKDGDKHELDSVKWNIDQAKQDLEFFRNYSSQNDYTK